MASNLQHEGGNKGEIHSGGGLGLEKAASEVLPEAQIKRIEEEAGKSLAKVAVEGIVGTIQDLLEPGKAGKKAGGHGGGSGGVH